MIYQTKELPVMIWLDLDPCTYQNFLKSFKFSIHQNFHTKELATYIEV